MVSRRLGQHGEPMLLLGVRTGAGSASLGDERGGGLRWGVGPRGATGIAHGAAWAAETGGGPGHLDRIAQLVMMGPRGTLVLGLGGGRRTAWDSLAR